MSTLAEIEAVVDHLSLQESEALLQRLTSRVRRLLASQAVDKVKRERWLDELDALRANQSPGNIQIPTQEILDDVRSDRF